MPDNRAMNTKPQNRATLEWTINSRNSVIADDYVAEAK